jgi:protein TonB
MDVKKHFGRDLEKRKKSFLAIGLLFSLAIVLAGFEYRTYNADHTGCTLDEATTILDIEEEVAPVFIPIPPPPPIKNKVVTDIELIDDSEEEDPIEIESLEIDESAAIDPLENVNLEEEPEDSEPENKIFIIVEKEPEFPGGLDALYQYLGSKIKYPAMAKDSGIMGIVNLTFVVEKDGTITGVKLLRDIGGGCGEEALRVIKEMPNWSPGKQRKKPVRVQFTLPVYFKLK